MVTVIGDGELEQNVTKASDGAAERNREDGNYNSIFNALNEAVMVHDAVTGRPLDTNLKMTELLGYSKEEIFQMGVADWSVGDPDRVQHIALQRIRKAAEGKPQLFEWQVKTKHHQRIWIEVSLIAATIGNRNQVLAVVRDITERKQAEKALRDSEQKYRDLVESTSDRVWEVNRKGKYTYSSPKVREVIGYEPDEVIGKTPFDFMPPDEALRISDLFKQIISQKDKFDSLENKNIHKNGMEVVLETSGVPVFDADGNWTGYRGIDRDITDRKLAEQERMDLVSQLNHARKMESIGTLAGGIAHDFNNILYMIIGNAELALEDIPDWNPVHANIEEIRSAGLRAAGIVKQLLNFSRKNPQEMKPIGATDVIREAIGFLRSTIPANIDIRAALPRENLTIMADPIQINQLMMNICINAAQAIEKNNGVIDIHVDQATFSEYSPDGPADLIPGKYLRIAIQDNGPGIEDDIIERIFEPYFTTRGVGEGSGMGLAVVHGIINTHGGIITVDSPSGKGAIFTIYLPLAAQKTTPCSHGKDDVTGGSETILLIDDEKPIVKMLRRMLERLGYQVRASTDPVKALDLFRAHWDAIDLVISDMTMPEMTGDRLAGELLKIRKDIPIILCTGFNETISEDAAIHIGIRSFVYKPIVKSDLVRKIRQALDHPPCTTNH